MSDLTISVKQSNAFKRTKLFAKRLIGREPWLRPALSLPTEHSGGWTYCPHLIAPRGRIYSLGVGCDINFDLDLINRFAVEVHAFDPTPSSTEWLAAQATPSQFHFHPWAVAAHDHTMRFAPRRKRDGTRSDIMYTEVAAGLPDDEHQIKIMARSLTSITMEFGHSSIDMLKMDIEGAEYDVITALLETTLRPAQILVEFHHRHPGRNKGMTVRAIEQLDVAGYSIFAISSTGREFSFASREAAST